MAKKWLKWKVMALRQYCKERNIRLIEIPYTEFNNIDNILAKELKFK
jgi:hypothetical protein